MPNKDIAAKVGVAPSTCLERIRRMRRNGTIVATRAHVLPSLLGKGVQAFLGIQIRPNTRVLASLFQKFVCTLQVKHRYSCRRAPNLTHATHCLSL